MPGDARGRVVVGYDGSEAAKAALRWAIDEARRRDATVEIIHAWQFPRIAFAGWGTTMVPLIAPADLERAAEEVERQALSDAAAVDATVEVTASASRGHPAEVLVAAAADADLLVVGSRGHGGFAGMLLGSVSHSVAAHAACPVVIGGEKGCPTPSLSRRARG